MIERIECGPRMSQAVKAAGLVFVSGQIDRDSGGDVAGQTAAVLAKIDDVLARAGTDKTNLVSASIWLSDMAGFAAMNTVWDEWLAPGAAPARATVEARLASPDLLVEIAVVAAA